MIRLSLIASLLLPTAACASQAKPPVIAYDPAALIPATVETAPPPPIRIVEVPKPLPLPGQLLPRPSVRPDTLPPMQRVAAANRAATREPTTAGYINAVQVYPWTDGALYRLYTAPGHITDITLQPGETLVSVAAGDTVRWVIGDTSSGAGETAQVHVLVKPFAAGLATNMVVTTDRRAYHLALDSTDRTVHVLVKPFAAGLATNMVVTTDRRAYHLALDSTDRTAMAAVSWTYPQDQLVALRRQNQEARATQPIADHVAIADLHFRYAISGDNPSWRPVRAWDDGAKVYIEFPARLDQGEAPPLFVLSPTGDAQLVNYRVSGNHYIVDRLFAAAELRLGAKPQQVVRIVRTDDNRGKRS